MRVVSLVPSVTEAIAAFGAGEALVGVTDWCEVGAPEHAARVGGTKNPSIAQILALRPDLVVVNEEENRREDAERLMAAGVEVLVTYPRRVADVPPMLRELGRRLRCEAAAEPFAASIDAALSHPGVCQIDVEYDSGSDTVRVVTLVWRKPWMAVGPGTYADDLLRLAGMRNVLADAGEPYPRIEGLDSEPDVVLLPSEPYAFGEADLDAVRALVGDRPVLELVDGRLLTWHGVRTAEALATYRETATRLAGRTRRDQ